MTPGSPFTESRFPYLSNGGINAYSEDNTRVNDIVDDAVDDIIDDIVDGKDLPRCFSSPRGSVKFIPFLSALSLLAGVV